MTTTAAPTYDADLFSRDGIVHPYGHYRALRELGGAVFLAAQGIWAIPRYEGVKRVLADADTFISGRGIAVSDEMNAMLTGSIITSDGEAHTAIRVREAEPLTPRALEPLRRQVREEAAALIDRLAARREFDALQDLACHLPVTIVAELVGLPERGRENMLEWSASIFQLVGPLNELSRGALARCGEMFEFADAIRPQDVRPGSWAARIFALHAAGAIDRTEVSRMLIDLIGPALDTTIFGIGNMILLLGNHPEQWALLRRSPDLVPNAVNEALRLESPIRAFTRYCTRAAEFDGVEVPAGARLLVLYASANRDERQWGADAEQLRVDRADAGRQLAFGYGRHQCLGMHLARLEMGAILEAMVARVERYTLGEPRHALITSMRGLEALPAVFH